MLDEFTTNHLRAWLEAHVHDADRDTVLADIIALLSDHADLLNTHSWSEIRRLAERNAA